MADRSGWGLAKSNEVFGLRIGSTLVDQWTGQFLVRGGPRLNLAGYRACDM